MCVCVWEKGGGRRFPDSTGGPKLAVVKVGLEGSPGLRGGSRGRLSWLWKAGWNTWPSVG